jgi:ribosomal protein S6
MSWFLILRTDVEMKNETRARSHQDVIHGDRWRHREDRRVGYSVRQAYEIKDSLDGVYYILYFEATQTRDEVTRVLGITDGVLRYMPLKHEKPFNFQQFRRAGARRRSD